MIDVEKTKFINRPQQEVFDFASNPANLPKWQSQITSTEMTSPEPYGVGSTQRSVAKFMGRDIVSNTEVTFLDAPNQFVFKLVGGPLTLEGSMRFESSGSGTQMTMGGKMEPGGFFKLAEGLVRKQLEKQFEENLAALKTLLEAGS
jgi:carbon monoxide dehydrogenase subunit G